MTYAGEDSSSGLMMFTDGDTPASVPLGTEGQVLTIEDGLPIFTEISVAISGSSFGNLNIIDTESTLNLTNSDVGSLITNTFASGDPSSRQANLPVIESGLHYIFVNNSEDNMKINAPSGVTIRIDGTVSNSGGCIASTAIGDMVRLAAINDTEWVAISVIGTWNFDFVNEISIDFDGVDEYLELGNVHAFEYDDVFSYTFWIKTTQTTNSSIIIGKMKSNVSPYRGYRVNFSQSNGEAIEFQLRNNQSGSNYSRIEQDDGDANYIAVNDGSWHHVACTYDGSGDKEGLEIYVDGILQDVERNGDGIGTNTIVTTDMLRVGQDSNADRPCEMRIDEIGLFDKELSQAEVAEIYNGGEAMNLQEHSAQANLIMWLRGDGDIHPTIIDQAGATNATMTNMEPADLVEDAP
jgi:concanavalin A-like lectin/glucanase superfamily protein